jgi:hypothetical protein
MKTAPNGHKKIVKAIFVLSEPLKCTKLPQLPGFNFSMAEKWVPLPFHRKNGDSAPYVPNRHTPPLPPYPP